MTRLQSVGVERFSSGGDEAGKRREDGGQAAECQPADLQWCVLCAAVTTPDVIKKKQVLCHKRSSSEDDI